MRRQRRVNPLDVAFRDLRELLNATVAYHSKQDPISQDEKIALWHWEIGQPLLEAIEVVSAAGFAVMNERNDRAQFAVPEWDVGIRWKIGTAQFLRVPLHGPYAIKLTRYGTASVRVFTNEFISDVLGDTQTYKLREWAKLAHELGVQIAEAKLTLKEVFGMMKTPGQLNRMIPELAQYLPDLTQKLLAEQMRKSPFPEQWAAYDKSKVERMLVEVARSHLVRGSAMPVHGDDFTWAQKLPHA